jgi:hypothetical protein
MSQLGRIAITNGNVLSWACKDWRTYTPIWSGLQVIITTTSCIWVVTRAFSIRFSLHRDDGVASEVI